MQSESSIVVSLLVAASDVRASAELPGGITGTCVSLMCASMRIILNNFTYAVR